MTQFERYKDAYRTIKMERRDGILQLTLHTENGPLLWNEAAHSECASAFGDVARDPENRVVILTGTGNTFSGPSANKNTFPRVSPAEWESIRFQGMQLTLNLLDLPGPVISCINGPAFRHAEIPFTADIVLAADDAFIHDSGHFSNRVTPGDGINLFFTLLLGWNRGRYFLLTGQKIGAPELKDLGLVAEVMSRAQLLPRAWELAEELVRQNPLVLRYTRLLLTHPVKMQVMQYLGYGLALEGLGAAHEATGKVGYEWEGPTTR